MINGETGKLAEALTKIGNLFHGNIEIMTSEARFTDRIFKFKHNYVDAVFNQTLDTSTSFDTLYFTVSGKYDNL